MPSLLKAVQHVCRAFRSTVSSAAEKPNLKSASVQQPLFMEPLPFPLSSRAYPDFLLHCSHQRHFCGSPQGEPHAVDRSHNSRQEIRGSRGICGSADLSWKRGILYSIRIVISPAPAYRGTGVAQWRDLRFSFNLEQFLKLS